MTTVAVEKSSATDVAESTPATGVMVTTDSLVSTADHAPWQDEGEVPMTSLSTDREPAYSMTSLQNVDVTTATSMQPTAYNDVRQQGVCYFTNVTYSL